MTKDTHLSSDSSLHTRFPHVPVSLCALSVTCGCLDFSFFLSKGMSKYSGRGRRKRKSEEKKNCFWGPSLSQLRLPPRCTVKHHCVRLCLDQQSSNPTPAPLYVMERKERAKKKVKGSGRGANRKREYPN